MVKLKDGSVSMRKIRILLLLVLQIKNNRKDKKAEQDSPQPQFNK